MRSKRSMRFAYQAANCGLCHRPIVFPSGFWFDTEDPEFGIVHPDCMMYRLQRGPVRAGAQITRTCNEGQCVNPAHLALDLSNAEWDPCDPSEPIEGQSHVGCYTAEPLEWVFDHFHALVGNGTCKHHHESQADADLCAGSGL